MISETIAALMKGPKSVADLCEYQQVLVRNAAPIRTFLRAAHEAGIVRIAGYRQCGSTAKTMVIWGMQPSPFSLQDHPKPETAAQIGRRLGVKAATIYKRRNDRRRAGLEARA
jgi:hypothetical protein